MLLTNIPLCIGTFAGTRTPFSEWLSAAALVALLASSSESSTGRPAHPQASRLPRIAN